MDMMAAKIMKPYSQSQLSPSPWISFHYEFSKLLTFVMEHCCHIWLQYFLNFENVGLTWSSLFFHFLWVIQYSFNFCHTTNVALQNCWKHTFLLLLWWWLNTELHFTCVCVWHLTAAFSHKVCHAISPLVQDYTRLYVLHQVCHVQLEKPFSGKSSSKCESC